MAMSFPVTQPAPAPRGRSAIVTGLVLLLVGVVIAVIGIAAFGATASSLLKGLGSPVSTPVQLPKTLEQGTTYAVYEEVTSGTGTTGDPYLGNIAPGDITVQATDGSAVIVTEAPAFSQTFSDGTTTYIVVATFDPPASGEYVVSVTTEGSTILVAPSMTAFAKALPWLLLVGLGAMLGLAGLIVFIVGMVRRSSGRGTAQPGYAVAGPPGAGYPTQGYPSDGYPPQQPAPAARPTGLPAPGWYPDPERPGGRRYWNGTGWTDSRA